MRNTKLILLFLLLLAIGLAVGEATGRRGLADEPDSSAANSLTPEQKTALAALDVRLAAVETLAAKIDDPAYKSEVARQIDDLKRSRLKIEKNFDLAAYEALMHSVISRYQVTALWFKSPPLPPPHVSPRSWKPVTTLPAPEANQAAAADDKFIYAIANAKVAKYDRQTGKLLAISTGEAKHLNSGFLWQGQLYCAHSNYPATPERSEIKVLDIESMQLTTFKDFGNFGGSLTWAVHESDYWWCNFARYGDDNAKTFLVKFDEQWREVARWTYPPDVISQIGRMSLSGGLWQAGSLLVTDHDHRVLYELRLPEQGSVLRFVTRHSVPFTGQGIATDSLTGGLMGIDRPKRQVVLAVEKAAEPLRLRVLSYNIHHCEGIDGKLDVERIAQVIRAVEPDFVALQEVDQKVHRSQSVDQPAELARLTKMHVVFGANIALQEGSYGNAVLSRYPIQGHENHKLPRLDNGEQRGVLEVQADLPGFSHPLLFLATHLDNRPKNEERLASAQAILDITAVQPDRPALLAGDLNDLPESAVLGRFEQQWSRADVSALSTVPVGNPRRQIDYILLRPSARWRVIEAKVINETVASDHRPIVATLELLPDLN